MKLRILLNIIIDLNELRSILVDSREFFEISTKYFFFYIYEIIFNLKQSFLTQFQFVSMIALHPV